MKQFWKPPLFIWYKLESEGAILNENDVVEYKNTTFKIVGFPAIISNGFY